MTNMRDYLTADYQAALDDAPTWTACLSCHGTGVYRYYMTADGIEEYSCWVCEGRGGFNTNNPAWHDDIDGIPF